MKPLAYWQGGLVCAKHNCFYIYKNGHRKPLFKLYISFLERVLRFFDLYVRAARTSVYSAVASGDDFWFAYAKKLYHYNSITKKVAVEHCFEKGRGPLHFSDIKNVPSFDDGIYFGEYISNVSKDKVSIFKRQDSGVWEVCFTFDKGEVNHIHALIPDSVRDCVWILAGDFGNSAGIWMALNNFRLVEKVVCGEQKYRACVAYPVKEGLLYATDSQLEENHIRLLSIDTRGQWESKVINEIKGSCIYGLETESAYLFSTSTEPVDATNKIKALLDNKPGPGIKHNSSDIVMCNKGDYNCQVIVTKEKDILPYRAFQFGTIMFPQGKSPNDMFCYYNVGSRHADLTTEFLDLRNILR